MEQPAKSSKVKPIGLLIADGREVAQRLEPALRATGPKRIEALQVPSDPISNSWFRANATNLRIFFWAMFGDISDTVGASRSCPYRADKCCI
jgi:hypothetical protein